MSITINPARDNLPNTAVEPKKKIFGAIAGGAHTQNAKRVGVYTDNSGEGLHKTVERMVAGAWYSGPRELLNVVESYAMAIAGDRQYGSAGTGASFGFIGHLARRLPAPILFDDPQISAYIFGQNKPTAAVDTSGRMWIAAEFLEECLKEEARDKTMVVPLFIHEYLHIALNHTKRMHNFPPDISNIAKDKVINPMAIKMFDANKVRFSDTFRLAHGNAPEDKRYEGLSEETVAKLLMQERRERLENKGTIRIKNLIIEDGTVGKITVLTAGKGEVKEFDTVVVKVQDMGMMDKVDTEFDCASLEVENIDNRLKVRRRPGGPGSEAKPPESPIEIPVESDSPSQGQGNGKGKAGKPPAKPGKPDPGQGGADANPDAGNDPSSGGRKSLEDIQKDMAGKGAGSGAGTPKPGDPQDAAAGGGTGDKDPAAEGAPKAGAGGGKNDPNAPQDPAAAGGAGGKGTPPQEPGAGTGAGAAGQPAGSSPQNQAGAPNGTGQQGGLNSAPGQDASGTGAGQQPGLPQAGLGVNSKGHADPQSGSQAGDPTAGGVNNGKGANGAPEDVLGGLIRGNPMNTPGGHEVNLDGLNDWLKQNGYEDLLGKMRVNDDTEAQVERAIEVALKEADKERLIIGSGYAGGHVEDYMHTVVRPNSIYKINWLRRALDFLQGEGANLTSTLEEYGVLTYISPEDMGMPEDEGIYYPGTVQTKPEGIYGVIIDTSGSIWSDKVRLGHLAAFAMGITGTRDDMSPDTVIVGADTVVSGKPVFYDAEEIVEAIDRGIPLGGGGGTDYTLPLNQLMAWAAAEDKKLLGVIYLGDFEVSPPQREALPEDMPPVFFIGMPHDVVRAASFVESVSTWAEVRIIEDDMTLDAISAEAKAEETRGRGHNNLSNVSARP